MRSIILPFVLFLAVFTGLISCNSQHNNTGITQYTIDNFQSETANGVVLVDFWASWCMPCKAMAPIIDEIALQTKGYVKVGKIDIDQEQILANQFGIQAIPTMIIFKDGKEVERLTGMTSQATLLETLAKYTEMGIK